MKRYEFLAMMVAPFLPIKKVKFDDITRQQISNILFKTIERGIESFEQLGYATKKATINIDRFHESIQEGEKDMKVSEAG